MDSTNLNPAIDLDRLVLPPLPDITDAALRGAAFTHRSAGTGRTAGGDVVQGTAGDYEKLAHVGDALLQAIVTCTLHDAYPDMSRGTATRFRSSMVDQHMLAVLSVQYRLPNRVRADVVARRSIAANPHNAAEMFEAYVAALYQSCMKDPTKTLGDGMDHLDAWLRPIFQQLWEMLQADSVDLVGRDDPLGDIAGAVQDEVVDLESVAQGSKMQLHELHQQLRISRLNWGEAVRVLPPGARGQEGQRWKMTCSVRYRDQDFTKSYTYETKKKAGEIVAYLILRELQDAGFPGLYF